MTSRRIATQPSTSFTMAKFVLPALSCIFLAANPVVATIHSVHRLTLELEDYLTDGPSSLSFSMGDHFSMSYSMSYSMPMNHGCGEEALLQLVAATDNAAGGLLGPLVDASSKYNDGSLSEQELSNLFLEGIEQHHPILMEMYAGFEDGNFTAWFQEGFFEEPKPKGFLPFVYSSVVGNRDPCEVPADAPDQVPLEVPEGSLGTCTYREFFHVRDDGTMSAFRNIEYDFGARPWWTSFQDADVGSTSWAQGYLSIFGDSYTSACTRLEDGVACSDIDMTKFVGQLRDVATSGACCESTVAYAFYISPTSAVDGDLFLTSIEGPEGAWVSPETGLPVHVLDSASPIIRDSALALANTSPDEKKIVINVEGVEYNVYATAVKSLGGIEFPGGPETSLLNVLVTPTVC